MAYKIKAELIGTPCPVYRVIKIPGSYNFRQLHQIIQAAFSWSCKHAYLFKTDKTIITEKDEDTDSVQKIFGADHRKLDSENVCLSEILDTNKNLIYRYDYASGWLFEIKTLRAYKEKNEPVSPLCLEGEGCQPPEDIGGLLCYNNFLEIISDPGNEDRAQMLEWAEKYTYGGVFRPDSFSVNEANRNLLHAFESDENTAIKLFTGDGLNGRIFDGWYDTIIESDGKEYSMKWIANMLLKLGEGAKITIKVNTNTSVDNN